MCDRHPIRRRPSTCETCAREIEAEKNGAIIGDTIAKEPIVINNENIAVIDIVAEKVVEENLPDNILEVMAEANISHSKTIIEEEQVVSHVEEVNTVVEEISKSDDINTNVIRKRIIQEESVKPREHVKEDPNKKKENNSKSIIKDVDKELIPIIRKEIDKLTPNLLQEFITDELREKINEVVKDIFDKAVTKFKNEIKSFSNIQYEHLNVPLNYFNISLMDKLQKEGWGFKEILKGDAAKISGFKTDTVLFVRVKNDKWPEMPTFDDIKKEA